MIEQKRPAGVVFDKAYYEMIYKTSPNSGDEGSNANSPQRIKNGGDNVSTQGSPNMQRQ